MLPFVLAIGLHRFVSLGTSNYAVNIVSARLIRALSLFHSLRLSYFLIFPFPAGCLSEFSFLPPCLDIW